FDDRGAGGLEFLAGDFTAIELLQKVGQVLGNEVNDFQFQGLFGGNGGAFSGGRFGPLDIFAAFFGDGFNHSCSEVFAFLGHDAVGGFLAAEPQRDRVGGANAGVRGHSRDIGGEGNETTGAGGAGAGRSDIHDRRHLGGVECLGDFLGRLEQ